METYIGVKISKIDKFFLFCQICNSIRSPPHLLKHRTSNDKIRFHDENNMSAVYVLLLCGGLFYLHLATQSEGTKLISLFDPNIGA